MSPNFGSKKIVFKNLLNAKYFWSNKIWYGGLGQANLSRRIACSLLCQNRGGEGKKIKLRKK